MNSLVAFFEIPAADFPRAVKFYESVLGIPLSVVDCGPTEKMACFPNEDDRCPGAISWSANFKPSSDGPLVSLQVNDIETALASVVQLGGRVTIPKTAIEAEGLGSFATFIDSEGNRIGLFEKIATNCRPQEPAL